MNISQVYNKNKYKLWLSIFILSTACALLINLLEYKEHESASYIKVQGKIVSVLGSEDILLGRERLVISLDDGKSYSLTYDEMPFLENGDIIELEVNLSDVSNNKEVIYAKSYKMIKEFQNLKIEISRNGM